MTETIQVAIPRDTVNDESVRILAWKFASGATVAKDELICEVETSKAVMEIHAPGSGVLEYSEPEGSEVPIGASICQIHPAGRVPVAAPVAENTPVPVAAPVSTTPARLTPLAARIAAECGIAVSAFPAGSLVRKEDVLRMAGMAPAATPKPAAAGVAAGPAPRPVNAPSAGVPVKWEDLPRRKVVEGSVLAAGTGAAIVSSVTTLCRVPMLRKRVERLGMSAVGVDALIVFEVARLLRRYPMFNAVYAPRRIGVYEAVNVGWAIDSGRKLSVPVVPDADKKTLPETAAVMDSQLEEYLEDKLPASAFGGCTFTVTNLSADGVSFFQPLIGQGQSAILGVGAERRGEEEWFFLTLAFDHQIAEGRTAAQFVGELRNRLEAHSATEEAAARDEMHCCVCLRDAAALRGLKAMLVRSEIPPGLVCSLCLGGLV